jgi:hypothetical protein
MAAPFREEVEEAERGILAIMLTHPHGCEIAAEHRIRESDFYRDAHRRIFAATMDLYESGEVRPNAQIVAYELLDADDRLLVHTLAAEAPLAAHAHSLAALVVRDALRRRRQTTLEIAAAENANGGLDEDTRLRLIDALSDAPGAHSDPWILTVDELENLPEPEWIIGDYLVKNGLNVMFGPPASFKSFLALDWACTLAHPDMDTWFGRPCATGRVLYIAAEGGSGIRQRIQSWRTCRGLESPPLLHVMPRPVNLFQPGETAVLIGHIDAELPEPPILIVVDTVARCMTGGDEDRARDMAVVLDNISAVQRRYDAAALLAHHTGHTEKGRERGSSALGGAADMRIGILRDEKQRSLTEVTAAKAKDAAEADPITLRLDPIPDTKSLAITGIVAEPPPTEAANDELAALILSRVAQQDGPTVLQIREACHGYGKPAIDATRKALIEAGKIATTTGPRNAVFHWPNINPEPLEP